MLADLLLLARVVGFLAAISVLARACAAHGLFEAWAGALRYGAAALVGLTAVAATAFTVDNAAVLLAPVLVMAAAGPAVAHATVRAANTGSMLLPFSNVAALLAFGATGMTFGRFVWLMLPVWVVGLALEWAIVRWRLAREPEPPAPTHEPPAVPLHCTAVLIVVVMGIASGLDPWVPAVAGALIVTATAMRAGLLHVDDVIESARLPLAVIMLIWGATVIAVRDTPAGDWFADLVPSGSGWLALVGTALVAMVLAGLVNNFPAALLLLPGAAVAGPVTVLAMLIGLGAGANLTVIGSLGNLLWWRTSGSSLTTRREFHRLSLVATPVVVVACASTLWAWTTLLA